MIPRYLTEVLLARRKAAIINRTPLPVVVMHPGFVEYIVRAVEDENGVLRLPLRAGEAPLTILGFVVKSDKSVPFSEYWFEDAGLR